MFLSKKIAAAAGAVMCSLALCAGHLASVGKTEFPPSIDGNATESCWKKCLPMTGMVVPVKLDYAGEQTVLKLCYDDKNLYGLAVCSQKGSDKLPMASPTHDDAKLWQIDAIELFFQTDNTIKQVIFSYNGSVYDAISTQDEKTDWVHDVKWNSGATVKASHDSDSWTVEFSIPLKNLGIISGKDTGFNFVRNNAGGKNGSSWSRLEKHNWLQPENFSTLKFVRSVPSFDFKGLPVLEPNSQFTMAFQSVDNVEVKLKVQNQQFAKKAVPGGALEFKYNSNPPTPHVSQDVQLEILQGGKRVYFFTYKPLSEYIALSPYNLSNGKLFLGSIIDAQIAWDSRHNFPGFTNGNGGKANKAFEIIFEVPEGITPQNAVKTGQVDNDGIKYNVFSRKEKAIYNGAGWLHSDFKCNLPPGVKGNIRYYAKWDGGQQALCTIPYDVIDIRPAPLPKRFITGFYRGYVPDLATAKAYAQIGFNMFSIRGSDDSAVKRAQEFRKAGFFLKREHFWPGAAAGENEGWQAWCEKDRSARAKDIGGYYIPSGKSFQISPSYRGNLFDEAIKKEGDFCKRAGINYFGFDMEGYIQPNGTKADFHERTLEFFPKYFAENYPDITYMDPKVFERTPAQYPKYHTAWVNFKCWLWADFFQEMRKRLAAECTTPSSPYPGAVFTEWCLMAPWEEESRSKTMRGKEWFDAFNFIETDNYSSLDRDIRQTNYDRKQLEVLAPGKEVKFIWTPSPNRLVDSYYKSTAPEVKNEHKYSLMEAAGYGFKGAIIFHRDMMNLDTMRQFADGIRIVCKCEDLVMDGKRVKNISCDQPNDLSVTDNFFGKKATWDNQERVFVKALELNGRTLVCVSEYREQKNLVVTVNYRPGMAVTITDVETDEIIGRMTADASSFQVTLEPERRCKLLLLTPEK